MVPTSFASLAAPPTAPVANIEAAGVTPQRRRRAAHVGPARNGLARSEPGARPTRSAAVGPAAVTAVEAAKRKERRAAEAPRAGSGHDAGATEAADGALGAGVPAPHSSPARTYPVLPDRLIDDKPSEEEPGLVAPDALAPHLLGRLGLKGRDSFPGQEAKVPFPVLEIHSATRTKTNRVRVRELDEYLPEVQLQFVRVDASILRLRWLLPRVLGVWASIWSSFRERRRKERP